MNYYTADLHLYQERVIQKCSRPFADAEDMNKKIIENFNSVIDEKDTLYILGDIGHFKSDEVKTITKIKGRKVLIVGNHDRLFLKYKRFCRCFDEIYDIHVVYDEEHRIFLCHYPMAEWDGYYRNTYHFYGHVHNQEANTWKLMQQVPKAYNVGVDCHNFFPVTARELINGIKVIV